LHTSVRVVFPDPLKHRERIVQTVFSGKNQCTPVIKPTK
jgi:hypothetical protein